MCSLPISIPKGSNLPVVVFRASLGEDAFDLTVVDKDHLAKYKVNGNLVFNDEKKESLGIQPRNITKAWERHFLCVKALMRECKSEFDEQNEATRKNNNLMKFRISELPC